MINILSIYLTQRLNITPTYKKHDKKSNKFGEIIYPGTGVTKEKINLIEQELKIQFPEDFRKYMLLYDDCTYSDTYFYIRDLRYPRRFTVLGDSWDSIRCMRKLELKSSTDIVAWNTDFFQRGIDLPKELLVIASTQGFDPGGEICICVEGEDYGKIYYWSMALYWDIGRELEDGGPVIWDHIFLLADSFAEFIESMTPEPDTDILLDRDIFIPRIDALFFSLALKLKGDRLSFPTTEDVQSVIPKIVQAEYHSFLHDKMPDHPILKVPEKCFPNIANTVAQGKELLTKLKPSEFPARWGYCILNAMLSDELIETTNPLKSIMLFSRW